MNIVLHPGRVRASDGDIHYISESMLVRLYEVDAMAQTFIPGQIYPENALHLYPLECGGYRPYKHFALLGPKKHETIRSV